MGWLSGLVEKATSTFEEIDNDGDWGGILSKAKDWAGGGDDNDDGGGGGWGFIGDLAGKAEDVIMSTVEPDSSGSWFDNVLDKGKQPGSKCSQKESAGGWYEGKEVTGIYFPLVSEFSGTFGGKPVNVRVVFSPGRKLEGKFQGGELDTQALLDTVHKTAEQLVIALQ